MLLNAFIKYFLLYLYMKTTEEKDNQNTDKKDGGMKFHCNPQTGIPIQIMKKESKTKKKRSLEK